MNLIYTALFYQETFINLLELFVESISTNGNIDKNKTDILILTSPNFLPKIKQRLSEIDLPIKYFLFDFSTLFEAVYSRLLIFQYENIEKYEKILYIDTDVLINSDINIWFDIEIADDKIYALEEGNIGNEYWGRYSSISTVQEI